MTFGDLLRWLEKRRDENLAEDEPTILPEVTSEGGVRLPKIAGGE